MLPVKAPNVAVIVEVPAFKPVAMPVFGVNEALAVVPEVQVIVPGTGMVVPSVNNSTAVKSAVCPTAIVGFAGVIFNDAATAAVTVSVSAGETIAPRVAVIWVVPVPLLVAKPAELMVATVVVAEFQVTVAVRSVVEASLNVPVAVNCCVRPSATDGLGGVTAIEVSVMTVRVTAGDVTPLIAAVICVVPPATAVANPVVEIVAVAGVPEAQVAVVEMSTVDASLYVAVAVNC